MASAFYDMIAPDYGDGDNRTGGRPGYRVHVNEQDGGVGVMLDLIEGDPRLAAGEDYRSHAIFLHVNDAEELHRALGEAIERARPKGADHGWRVRRP